MEGISLTGIMLGEDASVIQSYRKDAPGKCKMYYFEAPKDHILVVEELIDCPILEL